MQNSFSLPIAKLMSMYNYDMMSVDITIFHLMYYEIHNSSILFPNFNLLEVGSFCEFWEIV
jgi:hypothetical protein